MDNNPQATITGPQHLGSRAFSLIVSKHARFAFILFFIAIAALVVKNVFGANVSAQVGYFMDQTVLWSLVLFFIFLCWAFFIGWLTYINYTFALEDDAFKIRRGIFSKKETAIPYRQIRDVNIERSFSQQLYGVSKLVILTVGEESLSSSVSESVIPVVDNIDKHLALASQAELLKRANVQKISQS